MKVTCIKCRKTFDDATFSTVCPHVAIMPAEDLERKKLALSLVEKPLRFHHMPEDSKPLYIQSVSFNGMVEIRGMAGEFAPHLFAVIGAGVTP